MKHLNTILFIALFGSFINNSFSGNTFYGNKMSPNEFSEQEKLSKYFKEYTVYKLDLNLMHSYVTSNLPAPSFTLQLGNEYSIPINLIQHDLRSNDYKLRALNENGIEELPRSETFTYKGTVNNDVAQAVRMSIRADYFSGSIFMNGEELFIEPANQFIKSAPSDMIIVYKTKDYIISSNATCASTEAHQVIEGGKDDHSVSALSMACALTEMVMLADYGLEQDMGSVANTENLLLSVMNLVEGLYSPAPLEIEYYVKEIIVSNCSTCDKLSTDQDASSILGEFKTWGQGTGHFSTTFDVASFWTSRDLTSGGSSGVIGIAYLGGICNSNKYNVIEHYTTSLNGLKVDQAHELGHNWNASHENGSTYIMNPTLSTANNTWDPTSTSSITTFKNSRTCLGSSCVKPPMAQFTSDVTKSCGGAVNFIDQSANNPASWSWNFGDGTSSNLQNPLHVYSGSGTYNVKLTATNTAGNNQVTKNSFVTVTIVPAPSTTDGQICSGLGNVNLSATGSGTGTIEWYDASSGGNLVNTGINFSPGITNTTTYHVSEVIHYPSQYTGATDNTISAGGNYNSSRLMIFDVFASCTLASVKVYAQGAGNRTIQVIDSSGAVVHTKTVNVPAGESRVALNFNLNPGVDYAITATGTTINLYRNNAGETSYPYTISNLISVKTTDAPTSATNYYYFFYDWEVKELSCYSARVPVTGYVVTPAAPTISQVGGILYCNVTNAQTYEWFFNGQPISGETSSSCPITQDGSYAVSITDINGCFAVSSSYNLTVGINEINSNNLLTLYPNPAGNALTVSIEGNIAANAKLRVLNILGEVVLEEQKNVQLKNNISLVSLSKGIYVLELFSSDAARTRKVFIKN